MKVKKIISFIFLSFLLALTSCKDKECKHESTTWIIDVEATCTEEGLKHEECNDCHEKLNVEIIEKTSHDLIHYEKLNPTCTISGYEAYDACKNCDYSTYKEIKALGHNYENGECTRCHKLVIEGLEYKLNEDKKSYSVVGIGRCTDTKFVIPGTYNELLVTSIGDGAFSYCDSLTSIEIPNSVTSIGASAFKYCSSLTSIEISNNVTSIGESAFYGCSSLESIIVDKNNRVYDSRENCNAVIETSSNKLILGCKIQLFQVVF